MVGSTTQRTDHATDLGEVLADDERNRDPDLGHRTHPQVARIEGLWVSVCGE